MGGGIGTGLNHISVGSSLGTTCAPQADSAYRSLGGGGATANSGAIANGSESIAIGGNCSYPTSALGDGSFALGVNALALGAYSIAIGKNASATAERGLAVGSDSKARGIDSVALGGATAASNNSYAVGAGALAQGSGSVAIGQQAGLGADTGLAYPFESHGTRTSAVGQIQE